MRNPVEIWNSIDRSDKQTLTGILVGLLLWWYFVGRHKYGVKKGMA